MRYTYTAAWLLRGGFSLPDMTVERVLLSSECESFILTRTPDEHLLAADRTQAIGRAHVRGLAGDPVEDVDAFVDAEIREIMAQRRSLVGQGIVLLHTAVGEVDANLEGKSRTEVQGQLVVLGAVDKRQIAAIHEPSLRAMRLSLALEARNPIKFRLLTSGVYLTDENVGNVHSITFYASGEATVTSELPLGAEESISDRYLHLRDLSSLASVQRLFSQMSDDGSDRLRSFLSGWAALEILISKTFGQLEGRFLQPFSQGGQELLRQRFLDRIRDVMKDKYRLTDKFIAVTAVLFPDAQEAELSSAYGEFCELKKLRDSIYHGEEFLDRDMPVDQLARLLAKYLRAYLADLGSV